MTPPRLVCVNGPLQGQSFPIAEKGLLLGRAQEADIRLEDNDVSRFHAEVRVLNGAIWVQDRGSRNGVFVNEKRVTSNKAVGPGDRITLGVSTFVVEIPEERTEEVTMNLDALRLPTPPPAASRPSVAMLAGGAVLVLILALVTWNALR